MSEDRPSFLLRLCVVVGGFVFLVGTVGAVYQFLHDEGTTSAAGPGLAPRVRVLAPGLAEGADLLVNMCYRDGDNDVRLPAKRLQTNPDLWLLLNAPTGRMITIEVIDRAAAPPRVLKRRNVALDPGETVQLDLSETDTAER